MRKTTRPKARKAGLSPGTLPPESNEQQSEAYMMYYNLEHLEERKLSSIEQCFDYKDKPGVIWINIDGVKDTEMLHKLGKGFGLHPLLLEDIACGGQRPKVDEYENHLFVVVQMLDYDKVRQEIRTEQVSFVLGKNYVLSFQEEGVEGDVFNPNRERLRGNKGRSRKMGPDYLIYSLIDTIVDNYFFILEKMSEKIEDMEIELISRPSPQLLHSIYRLKREIISLRKSVWPLREVISQLERDEHDIFRPETKIFIRDVYDHTIQVIDTIESYRDIISGMIDIYLSSVSNKTNSIMQVLTMISTIFIPLTFIVGVYGMNFEYLPELKWKYSYPVVWLIMLSLAISMTWYFKKKKWL